MIFRRAFASFKSSSFIPRFRQSNNAGEKSLPSTKVLYYTTSAATAATMVSSSPSFPSQVKVTTPSSSPPSNNAAPHHSKDGNHFQNPWKSFDSKATLSIFNPTQMYQLWKEWTSHPVPSPDLLPQVVRPTWGRSPSSTPHQQHPDHDQWKGKIKATWLGHACFLVEFPIPSSPTPTGSSEERGARVLFDPVFSKRCSPTQFIGPARVTQPPITVHEIPHVDAVVLSHNHYDHTDVMTLKHIYESQPKGSVHFFAPLGNLSWFTSSLGFEKEHVTELDWWQERDLETTLTSGGGGGGGDKGSTTNLRITALPSQHFSGRGLTDRSKSLWASWAIQTVDSKVWFAGDTGYRTTPLHTSKEDRANFPTCPAFKEIGEKFGGFDLGLIPIGAYDPEFVMSPVHCNPEDALEIHIDTKCKKSIGMHWGTWVLTCEELTEPPKRLEAAIKARGMSSDDFRVCNIGETVSVDPSPGK